MERRWFYCLYNRIFVYNSLDNKVVNVETNYFCFVTLVWWKFYYIFFFFCSNFNLKWMMKWIVFQSHFRRTIEFHKKMQIYFVNLIESCLYTCTIILFETYFILFVPTLITLFHNRRLNIQFSLFDLVVRLSRCIFFFTLNTILCLIYILHTTEFKKLAKKRKNSFFRAHKCCVVYQTDISNKLNTYSFEYIKIEFLCYISGAY